MLVIHPDECIDCGVCVPECPVDAESNLTPSQGFEKWAVAECGIRENLAKYYGQKKRPRPTPRSGRGKPDNSNYFSPNPGAGVIEADSAPPPYGYRTRDRSNLIQPGAAAGRDHSSLQLVRGGIATSLSQFCQP